MTTVFSPLVAKALADTGYDLIRAGAGDWTAAGISGSSASLWVRQDEVGVLLALPEPAMCREIGLVEVDLPPPYGMACVGRTQGAAALYESLRLLHSLQTHPASALAARLEARLAAMPATERTREIRQRIGQDLFREALMDLWQGRCAVTDLALPPELLRASHAKPWAKAADAERLDPFNGLLLAIHLDAMFDSGLITFSEEGLLLCSTFVDEVTRSYFGLGDGRRLRAFSPGHAPYLRWHRTFLFRGQSQSNL